MATGRLISDCLVCLSVCSHTLAAYKQALLESFQRHASHLICARWGSVQAARTLHGREASHSSSIIAMLSLFRLHSIKDRAEHLDDTPAKKQVWGE